MPPFSKEPVINCILPGRLRRAGIMGYTVVVVHVMLHYLCVVTADVNATIHYCCRQTHSRL